MGFEGEDDERNEMGLIEQDSEDEGNLKEKTNGVDGIEEEEDEEIVEESNAEFHESEVQKKTVKLDPIRINVS